MPAMEELNERFRADRFAAQAGVEIPYQKLDVRLVEEPKK